MEIVTNNFKFKNVYFKNFHEITIYVGNWAAQTFSKYFQSLVSMFKHTCWGKHNKLKHNILLSGFLGLNETVLLQVFISYYFLKDRYYVLHKSSAFS